MDGGTRPCRGAKSSRGSQISDFRLQMGVILSETKSDFGTPMGSIGPQKSGNSGSSLHAKKHAERDSSLRSE